jgi:hypothetical protein
LTTTIASLAPLDMSTAIAQTTGSTDLALPPETQQLVQNEAQVGHRQPRADQVPSEKNLMNPNDPINRENAELDRKISDICRGC